MGVVPLKICKYCVLGILLYATLHIHNYKHKITIYDRLYAYICENMNNHWDNNYAKSAMFYHLGWGAKSY